MMGLSFQWPHGVLVAFVPIMLVCIFGGFLLGLSLLLFLAPPEARDKRGWASEWWFQRA